MRRLRTFFVVALMLSGLAPAGILLAQSNNIKNNVFWDTKDGQPIFSQGGGVFRFADPATGAEKYYWYGVKYREAEMYRKDPSQTLAGDYFLSVTCYTSDDLVNWSFESDALTRDEVTNNFPRTSWVGRLGVAYIKELNVYAMLVQHVNQLLILVSDSPAGPFKWHHRKDMQPLIGTPNTGDQTVFTDPDTGISYLVYSLGKGRSQIFISEIGVVNGKVDLLDCTLVFKGAGREGNCMVKHNGKFYLLASNLYGWDSSYPYYLVAENVRGPYLPTNEMLIMPGSMDDYAHVTQTGFLINVRGTKQETVIYCGDRWADFAGNGLGYNQWVPLSFIGDTPYFNSLDSWNFNSVTGEWTVADDNNFVRNGSFEADRRYIPSEVKPIQEHLKGWFTKVYAGNDVVIGSDKSPVLNYFNTQKDRKTVVGEKSLNLSDVLPFTRKVFQIIEPTPFVTMPDGRYTLTAKVRRSGSFDQLEMYAESGGVRTSVEILKSMSDWTTVVLPDIKVRGGKAEVGFWAVGDAGAQCLVDDVSLVKSQVAR